MAFLYAAFGAPGGNRPPPETTEKIRHALERYCGQDTEGMGWIVEKLTELTKGPSG